MQKTMFQNGLNKFLCKNTVLWTYVVSDLKGVGVVETFFEKELKKIKQRMKKSLELKKY